MEYDEFLPQANKERFIVIQIEDPTPLVDLEVIAALDEIDILFFGPVDLSQGIGDSGDMESSQLIEIRKRVAEVAKRHGEFAGISGNLDNIDELVAMG